MKNLTSQFQELSKNDTNKSNSNSNPFIPPIFPFETPNNTQNSLNSEFESEIFKNFNKNLFGQMNAPNSAVSDTKDSYPNNLLLNNNTSSINNKTDEKKESKPSNPFVDAYSEMNSTPLPDKSIMNLFSGMSDLNLNDDSANLNMENLNEGNIQNIMQLYEVLSKLSDQKENNNKNLTEEEKDKELKVLFENLLEFLLKSEMLAEPLSQIKNSVISYLDKCLNILIL